MDRITSKSQTGSHVFGLTFPAIVSYGIYLTQFAAVSFTSCKQTMQFMVGLLKNAKGKHVNC